VGKVLKNGGVIAWPTDTTYALGCHLGDKIAVDRIRGLRRLPDHHHMTLVCPDLKMISSYARISNETYRILKSLTPGAYTFLLIATKEVPRRLQHPRKKTVGLRVPKSSLTQAILSELGEPLLTTTLIPPDDEYPMTDPNEIEERFGHALDLVVDGGEGGMGSTTVVDLTGPIPQLVRAGLGPLDGLV